jgi:AcrR family transcriptional regulator
MTQPDCAAELNLHELELAAADVWRLVGSGKKHQILTGAARVFAQDGYEGASMSRIASEAGVSKGTLYYYFPGKAELFAEYMHGLCERWVALLFDDLDYGRPVEETLHRIGRRMVTMLLSEQALTMHRMVVAEAEKFPELAQTFFQNGPARSIGHLSAYLLRVTQQGRLRIEDTEFAAEQFFALIQARLYMRRQLRLTAMPTEQQIAKVVDSAVQLFTRGYRA